MKTMVSKWKGPWIVKGNLINISYQEVKVELKGWMSKPAFELTVEAIPTQKSSNTKDIIPPIKAVLGKKCVPLKTYFKEENWKVQKKKWLH